MSPAAAREAVCEYQDEHPRIDERLRQLEDRAQKHDAALEKLSDLASGVNGRLERIDGKIEGALSASRVSGAIVATLITTGVGGLVAFLVALIKKG